MMRVDPQDREDIDFLLEREGLDRDRLQRALDTAVVPPVPEIREAFDHNLKWLHSRL